MFTSIWQDIKQQFSYGNTLTRILLVNVGVFVFITIARLILNPMGGTVYQDFLHFFTISSDWKHNLTHPWVLFTHMFLHESLLHLLWNVLLLYWFGRIVGDLLGDRRVLPIYLLGGVAGGLMYFVVANIHTPWDFGGYALGASAAFMAILLVAGKTAPDYIISLLFFGDVRLKYIVAVLAFLGLIEPLSWNNNSGGSFGHLGGALMGFVIASQLQRGNDLTKPVNKLIQTINDFFAGLFQGKKPRKQKVVFKNPSGSASRQQSGRNPQNGGVDLEGLSYQEKLDTILEKIKKSGYDSLTSSEKEFLFNASKR